MKFYTIYVESVNHRLQLSHHPSQTTVRANPTFAVMLILCCPVIAVQLLS